MKAKEQSGWLGVETHICEPPTAWSIDDDFTPELGCIWRCWCATMWEVFSRSGHGGVYKLGFKRYELPWTITEYHGSDEVHYGY